MTKIFQYISILALVISIFCFVLLLKNNKKTAFVQIEKVYDDFPMKKELEAKFENVTNMRQQILDSLKLQLNIISQKIKSKSDIEAINAFQLKRQEYALKEQNFSESTSQTNEQYKNQIWKQLSQYILEFGKKNNYKYILGFENKSSILYGDEAEDVTIELSNYVNESYKGGTK